MDEIGRIDRRRKTVDATYGNARRKGADPPSNSLPVWEGGLLTQLGANPALKRQLVQPSTHGNILEGYAL